LTIHFKSSRRLFRLLISTASLAAALLACGCSGESTPPSSATHYPSGVSEDIEKQLKYDARVESFDSDGDTLIVNVNDHWASSPPGMQERAVGSWYSMWQPDHKAGKVIVKFEGENVASWTADKGFQPEHKPKQKEGASDNQS
jgi:hypothetical protein